VASTKLVPMARMCCGEGRALVRWISQEKYRVTGESERVAEVPPKCIQDGKTVYSSATSSDASFLLHLSPAPEPSANGASARRGQPERRREPSIDFTAVV